jgi:hypothetical protein
MTLPARHLLVASRVNDRDFVNVRLHRGCGAGNTSTSLFGSTLALHSLEFCAVSIVARFAMGIRRKREV